jgi:hypothetical protein
MIRQRFASKWGVGHPSLFQLGFGKVGEEGRDPLPDSVSQEPNQQAVQNPRRAPGRPRQECSTAAAEAMKKVQRKDLDEASKRAKVARAALAKNPKYAT